MASTWNSGQRTTPAGELATVVAANIDELIQTKRDFENHRRVHERAGDEITRFAGSMLFVYLHAAWFAGWIGWNLGLAGLPVFDEFPFGLLTMIVSLEAIFLSTFVLLSQNRSARLADKRSDLDLQINLLAEHEVTRLIRLTEAMAHHLGVLPDDDLEELEQDVSPTAVLQELQRREDEAECKPGDTSPAEQAAGGSAGR